MPVNAPPQVVTADTVRKRKKVPAPGDQISPADQEGLDAAKKAAPNILPQNAVAPPVSNIPPVPVFRDNVTGDLSGFTDPRTGKTFLGASPEAVNQFVEARNRNTALPEGAINAGDIPQANQFAQKQQMLEQQVIPQIGQIDQLPTRPETGFGSALQGAAPDVGANVLSNAAAGAGIGAVAGLATTAGTLSIPGAIVGGIGGSIKGAVTILPQLREEFAQQREVDFTDYQTSVKNIKGIIDGVNKGLVDPIEAVDLYNHELAKIDRAERELKLLEDKDWISKARKRLTQVQAFNDIQRSNTANALARAIAQPNPNFTYNLPEEVQASIEDQVPA